MQGLHPLHVPHGPHSLSSHSLLVGDGVGACEGAGVGAGEGAGVGLDVGDTVHNGQSFGSSSFHSSSSGHFAPPCCGSVTFLVRFTLKLGVVPRSGEHGGGQTDHLDHSSTLQSTGQGLPQYNCFGWVSSSQGSASTGSTTTVRLLRTVSIPHGSLQPSHGPHALSSHSLFVGDGVGAGEGADVGAAEGAGEGAGVGESVQS